MRTIYLETTYFKKLYGVTYEIKYGENLHRKIFFSLDEAEDEIKILKQNPLVKSILFSTFSIPLTLINQSEIEISAIEL
jgi:hypothetical protein